MPTQSRLEEESIPSLHLTKRVGAPAAQAVVEARFAGERECSTGSDGREAEA